MVKRFRDLTVKYRSFRQKKNFLYDSRLFTTLFNKFIKQGKSERSKKHIFAALVKVRYALRRPRILNAIIRILRKLRVQLILVAKRQGRNIIDVPVPVRRNQQDIINLQAFYTAVYKRRERNLHERIEQEMVALLLKPELSSTIRQRSLNIAKIYEERVYIDKR
jgi:ribosomal protein S7